MSKSTISTFQLFEMFPDEESARIYLEGRLWPNGVKCPTCKAGERITPRKAGFYRCNACKEDFTVRTGTIFGWSHVPLHKWLYAMYLLVTACMASTIRSAPSTSAATWTSSLSVLTTAT